MAESALPRFVQHVLEKHANSLQDSFPGCFDWQGLCADVPAMAERLTDGRFDPADASQSQLLRARAEAIFRVAHLSTLAVLAARCGGEEDPASVLEPFLAAPEEEDEARFEVLVTEVLDPVEACLGGKSKELDERGSLAIGLLGVAWLPVQTYVAEGGLLGEAETDATRPVLLATARAAALLAVLRWMAGGPPA